MESIARKSALGHAAAKAIYNMIEKFGGEVGDMELRNESETCGWKWEEVEAAIEVLFDMELIVSTFGYDDLGRMEAAVRKV